MQAAFHLINDFGDRHGFLIAASHISNDDGVLENLSLPDDEREFHSLFISHSELLFKRALAQRLRQPNIGFAELLNQVQGFFLRRFADLNEKELDLRLLKPG